MSGALRWSGTIKKLKGHGPMLEETWPDHAIRSSAAITKLSLGRDIWKKKKKKNNKEEKCDFLKIIFLLIRNTANKCYGEILCKSGYI